MLGYAMRQVLVSDELIDLKWTERSVIQGGLSFEWEKDSIRELMEFVQPDFVINCIGMIPQRAPRESRNRCFEVNASLPHEIARACEDMGCVSIEIATDCVYSGQDGPHFENSTTTCLDEYSRSKRAGEVHSTNVSTFRCSIIGTNPTDKVSLLGWLLNQPQNAKIQGFTNHLWNGVTTLAYSKIVLGIIRNRNPMSMGRTLHVLPRDDISKFELLLELTDRFDRNDITIEPIETEVMVDRRLGTLWPQENLDLWLQAGYVSVPSVNELVEEFAGWYKSLHWNES
jgi:dTDP-4-dehydrorhamnose reductase